MNEKYFGNQNHGKPYAVQSAKGNQMPTSVSKKGNGIKNGISG